MINKPDYSLDKMNFAITFSSELPLELKTTNLEELIKYLDFYKNAFEQNVNKIKNTQFKIDMWDWKCPDYIKNDIEEFI